MNLSAAQFRGGDLPDLVADILRRTRLPAPRLELEVTESLLIDDTDLGIAFVEEPGGNRCARRFRDRVLEP